MRKRFGMVLIVLIIMSCCNLLFATSQEDFLHANDLYKRGDYADAQRLYASIDTKGAAVWYNLGNCWYHLKDYPQAIACWKRCLKYGGFAWYDDVVHNCSQAYEILGIQPHEVWYEHLVRTIRNYSLLWWQLVLILVSLVSCLLLLRSDYKKKSVLLGVMIGVMSVATSCLGIKYWGLSKKDALVGQEAFLVAGTDERFSRLATLKKGEEVVVYETRGKWSKVAANEGVGWILADTLIII